MPDQLDREGLDELLRLAERARAATDNLVNNRGRYLNNLDQMEARSMKLRLKLDPKTVLKLVELAREGLDARERADNECDEYEKRLASLAERARAVPSTAPPPKGPNDDDLLSDR